MRILKLVKWTFVFLSVFWATLYYSKSGLLVSGQLKTGTQPDTHKEYNYLTCKYFTGAGFAVKDYWKASPGKNESCPFVTRLNQ